MSAHLGGSRRPRKSAPRRSFKPTFDLLETRTVPTVLPVVPGASVERLFDGGFFPPACSTPAAPTGPAVVASTECLKVSPGGDAATFTLVLNTQPTADVTVTLAQLNLSQLLGDLPGAPSADGSLTGPGAPAPHLTISPDHVTFTTGNWNQAQTVKVSAPADPTAGAAVRPAFTTIIGTTTSDDPNYDALPVPPVGVAVVPQEANPPGVTATPDRLEVAPGGSTTFTLALDSQPTGDVTITISQFSPVKDPPGGDNGTMRPTPVGGSGPLTITPTTLTFTHANWQTPQTVTVSAPATTGDNGPGGGFAVLTFNVTSQDPNYNNLEVPPVPVAVEQTGGIVLSTDHLQVVRGGDPVTYTVALKSQPTADVTLTISQASPELGLGVPGGKDLHPGIVSPLPNDPLGIAPTTLTFTKDNWNTPQTVTVSPPATGSGDQFDLLVTTAASDDPNYNNLQLPAVGVAVLAHAPLAITPQKLDITAGGDAGSFTVALPSKPTANVTVTLSQGPGPVAVPLAASDGGDLTLPVPIGGDVQLTITPTTLTFTPDDWDMPQPVSVSAPASSNGGDGRDLGAELAFVQTTVRSDDPNYNGLTSPPVVVIVQNSSTTSPAGLDTPLHLKVTPGGDGTTFGISLRSKPTANVTVTIAEATPTLPPIGPLAATPDGTLPPISIGSSVTVTVTPTTLTFTPDNWDTPQQVTVTAPLNADGSVPIGVASLTYAVTSDDPAYNNVATDPTLVFVGPANFLPPDRGGPPSDALPIPGPVALPPAFAVDPPEAVLASVSVAKPAGGSGSSAGGHGPGIGTPGHHPAVIQVGHHGHHGPKGHHHGKQ